MVITFRLKQNTK